MRADESGAGRGNASQGPRAIARVLVGTVCGPHSGGLQTHRRAARSRQRMKVALVHDRLTGMRGGEKVLEVVCGLYPDADIHTLFHWRGSVSAAIERHRIHTSFLQYMPLARSQYRRYLPLFPMAIEHFDLDGCDLVVSSSHCAAKGVVAPGRARHVCYCHSPMRYAWDQFDAYFGPERV